MTGTPPVNPIVAVGAVVWSTANDVILIRRGRPPRLDEWSIPGGKVRWGETLAEAISREVREETGLTVELLGRIDVVDSLVREEDRVSHHHVLIDYTARILSGVLRAGDDAREARYVPFAQLDAYDMWPETRRIIALSHAKHTAPRG